MVHNDLVLKILKFCQDAGSTTIEAINNALRRNVQEEVYELITGGFLRGSARRTDLMDGPIFAFSTIGSPSIIGQEYIRQNTPSGTDRTYH